MLVRIVLLITSLAGVLLLAPATGSASTVVYNGTPNGAVFYDDQSITMLFDQVGSSGANACRIHVFQDGVGEVASTQEPTSPLLAPCDTTLPLPQLSAGTYRWEFYRVMYDGFWSKYMYGTFSVNARPRDLTPPVVPGGINATSATETTIAIAWEPSSDDRGVVGYGVYRDAAKLTDTTDRGFTATGLACGRAYTFGVDAYDAAGNRSGQGSINTTTSACAPTPDTTAPTLPSGLVVTSSSKSSVTLAWAASVDNKAVTGYGVYRDDIKIAETGSRTLTLTGLDCGHTYTVGVDAYDEAGNRSGQRSISATTSACPPVLPSSDTTAPTVPGSLAVTNSTKSSATLAWVASVDDQGVIGYGVYRDTVRVAETGSRTFTLTGLDCGHTYTLAVDAYDAAGNRSDRTITGAATAACDTTAPGSTPTSKPSPTPTPTPTPKPQPASAPRLAKIWAFKSTGRVGRVARLRVATEVGSKYSRYVIEVTWKNGTVATIKAPVLKRGLVQFVGWRVPKTVKPGTLRFSVQGLGATRSHKARAQLVVRS